MEIRYQKSFERAFRKLPKDLKAKTKKVIKLFGANPFDPKLKNHALKGKMLGKRSFSVTGEYRVIFEEHSDYTLIIMLKAGSHNQVY